VTTLRPIADFQLALRPTWAKIPPVPDDSGDWPLLIGKQLCDDEGKRRRLAVGLAAAHPDLIGPEPHVFAAVWVPDRTSGDMQGSVLGDWMLPDPGASLNVAYYRSLMEKAERPHLEILAQRMDEVTLPAGPALRIQERSSRSSGRLFTRRRTAFECVMYAVFPSESSDGLLFTFSTDALDLGDLMAEDADAALATLNIQLGESDAVT
jgi:hypothetical protein